MKGLKLVGLIIGDLRKLRVVEEFAFLLCFSLSQMHM